MPNPTNNVATPAVIIGNDTGLSAELNRQLTAINITVSRLDSSEETNLEKVMYIWQFLPEKTANQNENAKVLDKVKKTLQKIENTTIKYALILRHPNQYCASPNSESEITQHQNFLLNCVEEVKKNPKVNSRVIAVGSLLGGAVEKDSPLFIETPFNHLPKLIIEPENGNEMVRPMEIESVAKSIIKTMFSQHSKHQIYEIIGNNYTTISALVYEIAQKTKSLNIPFQRVPLVVQKIHFPSTQVKINNSKTIEDLVGETIKHTLLQAPKTTPKIVKSPAPTPPIVLPSPTPIARQSLGEGGSTPPSKSGKKIEKPKSQKASSRTKTHPATFIILGGVITIILAILLTPVIYLMLVKNTLVHLKNLNTASAKKTSEYAEMVYPVASKTTYAYVPIVSMWWRGVSVGDVGSLLEASQKVLQVAGEIESLKSSGENIVSYVVGSQKGDISKEINQAKKSMQSVYEQVSTIKAITKTINASSANPQIKAYIEDATESMEKGSDYLEDALVIIGEADKLFGLEKSMSYMVLLQNNQELRATGGFIGSFAILTIDKGKLLDIETYDVYSADGQLRGHVEPPQALKKHLGEANWYLRDSNWDPNFPTTARRAEWFLNKELGRQVDATIGINLFVVKDLLESLGGVELPDYNETINANNLFERAEFHSELNYFDGSTQKKDFLSAIINAMYVKLAESKNGEATNILASLAKNAKESQIQVSFRDDAVESALENTIFSGKVKNVSCGSLEEQCLADYFGVVESNVGVNKVNYFVERSITHKIEVGESSSRASTSLILKNTAQSNTWPAGTYKNYIRFVMPSGASVEEVKIDGVARQASELDVEVRHSKKYVGVYVEIPIAGQKIIDLSYQLKNPTHVDQGFTVVSLFEKQSGTDSDPLSFEIKNNTIFNLWRRDGELIETNKDIEIGTS